MCDSREKNNTELKNETKKNSIQFVFDLFRERLHTKKEKKKINCLNNFIYLLLFMQ